MNPRIRAFLKCEDGATAIEYGLISGLIGLGIIVGLGQVQTGIKAVFSNVVTGLNQ